MAICIGKLYDNPMGLGVQSGTVHHFQTNLTSLCDFQQEWGDDSQWGWSHQPGFYDVFKLDPDHISRYLTLICNRLVTLQDEFGKPVGRLDKFLNERHFPAAPQEEIEECKQQ